MPKNKFSRPRWKIADWTREFNLSKPEAEQVAESTVWRWCVTDLLDAEQVKGGVWAISTPPNQFTPPKAGRPVVRI